ncbi:Uncharacterized protein SCF082_LOCUS46266 [Durusdinium trenchii]|uniref:Uncharacterized protein n=1 Tax=Durusdinium trenchii TaxID=1381693 RepID=A0ABP0RGU0_9DINO
MFFGVLRHQIEVGITSKEAVNSMRSELLDLPDLLAVQPLPSTMNLVGWLSGSHITVGTQVYRFSDSVHRSELKLEEKAVLRIVSEPADLSNADIMVSLEQDGKTIAESDRLGQLVAEVDKGNYVLALKPKAEAPFLVTLAAAYETRLRADLGLADNRPCADAPDLAKGVDFSAASWTIGPSFLRMASNYVTQQGTLLKVPISLATSSVLYLEVGSALPLDLVRIALQVPEGLWVGEQRGFRNSLEIELPAGLLAYPHPPDLPIFEDDIKRCLDFSVFVRCMPVNPVRDQGTWCTSGPFTVNRAILLPARLQGWVIWGGLFVEGSVRIHYTTEGQWASISSM